MIKKIGKKPTGTIYWDTEEKQSYFIRNGDTPSWESQPAKQQPKSLEDMRVAELHSYAKDKGITIPDDVTKKQDVIEFLKTNG
ncbi:hypothetical protein [Levilactobacillus namurensis]|uniref:hypothetical protein n=1 Tax=Levilactobacillus namurensis TaxID=380393 RepID=UPI00223028AD|nr:hypothetical protein [Levilactobacillus namurensis]MCW3778501.1 hypothetical protein [Levilactobacillus namurensis]MDT7019578.1 hypothetical protein [Levilactobacillus namurensis]WNN65834.1 hypothetical protein RIN67_01715 [Levilactobacillus namurensis]